MPSRSKSQDYIVLLKEKERNERKGVEGMTYCFTVFLNRIVQILRSGAEFNRGIYLGKQSRMGLVSWWRVEEQEKKLFRLRFADLGVYIDVVGVE